MTKSIKHVIILLVLIFVTIGCFSSERVTVAPYVLLLNPTQSFLPTSTLSVFKELDLMLPVAMKNAISKAYKKALEVKTEETENFFERYAFNLIKEISTFSPTADGTYLEFRNELVTLWRFDKKNNYIESFYKNNIDAQSIVTIIMQAYGAYLNGLTINIDKLIDKEVEKDKNWKTWGKENLDN